MQQTKSKLIIGNWKMNKSIADTRGFVTGLGMSAFNRSHKIGLAVPYTMIAPAAEAARGTDILIGAQNMSNHTAGAYTGEIACTMLKEAGASFTLIGHSERRQYFGETDKMINEKVKLAIHHELIPVLCIGESKEQHAAKQTHTIIQQQIAEGLKGLNANDLTTLVIAYEPIWAIGTDKAATTADIARAHNECRRYLAECWGDHTAKQISILYGGSVKPENAEEIINTPGVDGLLVGGASLELESFNKILNI